MVVCARIVWCHFLLVTQAAINSLWAWKPLRTFKTWPPPDPAVVPPSLERRRGGSSTFDLSDLNHHILFHTAEQWSKIKQLNLIMSLLYVVKCVWWKNAFSGVYFCTVLQKRWSGLLKYLAYDERGVLWSQLADAGDILTQCWKWVLRPPHQIKSDAFSLPPGLLVSFIS